ncbi:MAG TPA: HNH endonuclease [Candidatus Dietzia intestinigallinarum]|nr:HNH endonuclease [Candidatus Dietzia intestinipullorum]HJC58945.1 HNH endonuclease [Candidatus Dietzia intestinigallinarum]
MTTATAKRCTKCDETKPLTDYHRKAASRDGHYARCKACVLASQKAWYRERVAAERIVPPTTDTKACTKCGEVKPLAEYYRNAKSTDGRSSQCKACRSAQRKTHVRRLEAERVEPAPTDTKPCTKCGEVKPLTEYHRNTGTRDGHQTQCKVCKSTHKQGWYNANREKNAARRRAWREANRDKIYSFNREYHARRWANDPEYRERVRAQRKAGFIRYHRLKANAKQEPYTRQAIFERDGWICGICAEPIDPRLLGQVRPDAPSIDHIVPLSRGGDDTPANVQAGHFGCNSGKRDRIEHEDQEVAA